MEKAIGKIVSQVLEGHVAQVRDELARRVTEEIAPQLEAAPPAGGGGSSVELLKAISAIHSGTTQREILKALLESMGGYSGRSALFVVKAGSATGWQGRGFANNEGVKDFPLDVKDGVASKALQSRAALTGRMAEMGKNFASVFGHPANDRVIILPLFLKDKIAALVYADSGPNSSMDEAGLEALVMCTSAWLEVASLRKRDGVESAPEKVEAAPVQAVSSHSDPFASHAPRHVAAPAAQAVAAVASAVESPVSAAAAAPAADPFAGLPPEDADLHRKAQRFARLLVDEIKLYNQVKVSEGRKHKDIYDRLKEDIEKSRGTYQKRYGNSAAASTDYFTQELIRSLAEDDVSFMGASFRR
ncbi:MAG TPA: hypothetical protein VGF06_01960 [Terriglobales bacterium]